MTGGAGEQASIRSKSSALSFSSTSFEVQGWPPLRTIRKLVSACSSGALGSGYNPNISQPPGARAPWTCSSARSTTSAEMKGPGSHDRVSCPLLKLLHALRAKLDSFDESALYEVLPCECQSRLPRVNTDYS